MKSNTRTVVVNMSVEYFESIFNTEETRKFAEMLNSPTQSYKYYWLEAIIKLRLQDITLTFEAIVNEMIFNAWYSVSLYHIHLGPFINGEPSSYLEQAVNLILKEKRLQYNESAEIIKLSISGQSKELSKIKSQLVKNVPYRILSSFLNLGGNDPDWNSQKRIIERINSTQDIFYTIQNDNKLDKVVTITPKWDAFIRSNASIILGWIQYNKIKFIQSRNPGVPCISDKLEPPSSKRDLEDVRKLWSYVVCKVPVVDMYSNEYLNIADADIDHFIPWTYVCNDELWNLSPVASSLNRSKSNNLADWNLYFETFADNQYKMYDLVLNDLNAKKLFERCRKNNLYSIWANELLYTGNNNKESFKKTLKDNMKPVYDSAEMLGYPIWNASMYKGYSIE